MRVLIRASLVICHKCGSSAIRIYGTRPNEAFVERWRKCLSCDHRWKTAEETHGDVKRYTRKSQSTRPTQQGLFDAK